MKSRIVQTFQSNGSYSQFKDYHKRMNSRDLLMLLVCNLALNPFIMKKAASRFIFRFYIHQLFQGEQKHDKTATI
ncbi:hypothetical protein CDL12_26511 [Handroanthus impetiginosus]|uniref:Uncharacterized protein n=1 Tax=Handroanthus impetiginosus TaxID=429701 RepID=A0A2G9G6P6_9LAMI|nr:hypothetical protein CDL12_26511 [Handroanthus impetiginosus]